jgi:Stress responsive A/B Barrel Domain
MNTSTVHQKSFLVLTVIMMIAVFTSSCATTSPSATLPNREKLVHVVLVWLNKPGSEAGREEVINAGRRLTCKIPEVQSLCIGTDFPYGGGPELDITFDVCLVLQFEDEDALDRYIHHPYYQQALKTTFLPLSREIKVYNFTSK